MQCHACHAEIDPKRTRQFKTGVSSDCQPVVAGFTLGECDVCGLLQKDTSAAWSATCTDIYANYKIYHQAAGLEQKARGALKGTFAPRSQLLVEFMRDAGVLLERSAALDIGCGNGAFLRTLQGAMPAWSVAGSELNDSFRDDITSIADTARFFAQSELDAVDETFGLVSLIHCLEHVPAPEEYLKNLSRLLGPDSVLLIQVPDAAANPFDLMVYDHCSHFSVDSLRLLASRAGYDVIECGNRVLNKEITLLARIGGNSGVDGSRSFDRHLERNLGWLDRVAAEAVRLSASKEYYVFGSSIAATWIGMIAGKNLKSYIDEDVDRVGRDLLGAPIVAIDAVPVGATVLVPLAPRLAQVIGGKLRERGLNAIEPH